ncbi:MAG: hypothetical protein ACYCO9_07005 [Streptosporangiaceae bacterium]
MPVPPAGAGTRLARRLPRQVSIGPGRALLPIAIRAWHCGLRADRASPAPTRPMRRGALRRRALRSARRPVPALRIGQRARRGLPVILAGSRHARALVRLIDVRRPRAARILTALPGVGDRLLPGGRGTNPVDPRTG